MRFIIGLLAVLLAAAESVFAWTHGVSTSYYVNASTGNDGNSGLSPAAPWATIGKINSFAFPAGNIVISLQGSFSDACLTLGLTNLSKASNVAVSPFGAGYTITANCTGNLAAAINVQNISNVTLNGGTLVGNAGAAIFGILINNPSSVAFQSGITINGFTIGGFWCGGACNPAVQYSAEIGIQRLTGDGPITNITVSNNTVGGASASSLDRSGILFNNLQGSSATGMMNVTVSGNVVRNIGGATTGGANGVTLFNTQNGTVIQNIVHDVGGNNTACGGPGGMGANIGTNGITFRNNEVYNVQPVSFSAGCDWDGMNIDTTAFNITMEYNYVHNAYGACMLLNAQAPYTGNVVRYNIFEGCGTLANYSPIYILGNSATGSLHVYNNTVYSTTNTLVSITGAANISGVIANNIFYGNASGQTLLSTTAAIGQTVVGNDYFQANAGGFKVVWNGTTYTSLATWQAAGGDASGKVTNPSLTSPGSGGTCGNAVNPNTCPTAYQLQGGSGMIGVGIDLTQAPYSLSLGATNYFGAAIPNGSGTGYNIGAQ